MRIIYYLQFYGSKTVIFFLELVIKIFVKNDVFFDKANFEWTKILEENYEAIKQEYININNKNRLIDATVFSKEQIKSVAPDQWSVFPLFVYGNKIEKNWVECPVTVNCLKQIPTITTAWFSVMKPGTYVKPHRGTYKGYLRCLMGLIVPDDITQSGLAINNTTYHWKKNECVIFDDTFIHSAYNNSEITRVVLYIDFIRPMPSFLMYISKVLTDMFGKSLYVKNMKLN